MSISIDTSNYTNGDHQRIGQQVSGQTDTASGSGVSSGGSSSGTYTQSTVTGEIVEKEGDQVTIDIGNNRTISATLQGNAKLEVGMKLTFEIAKGADNRLALRPLFSNLTNSNAAVSALRAAGLPVNDTTLSMTDKMMSESMPVNRNALNEMFRNVSGHPNASSESIVQMTKLNIPLTENNVIQYENYRNFEHQITSDLQNAAEGVMDLFKEAAANAAAEGSPDIAGVRSFDVLSEIMSLIDTDSLETIQPDESDIPIKQETVQGLLENEAAPVSENAGLTAGENGAETAAVSLGESAVVSSQESPTTAVIAENAEGVADNAGAVTADAAQILPSGIKDTVDGLINNLKDIFMPSKGQESADIPVNSNLSLSNNEQATLLNDLKDIMSLQGNTQFVSEPIDPKQVLETVRELLQEYPPENTAIAAKSESGTALEDTAQIMKAKIGEKLNDLIKSEGFGKLIKDSVKAQMSIKPQDVAQNGKIEELYDRIMRTSAKITELMESVARADGAAAKAAANLSDNVSFMDQLNQFVNYVQLPLKMAGEDANGELYVYTNRKNLANKDGNFSALLHLDMEHLGPMDVYVTMRNYTKVNTNFYLQSEELIDFMEAHIDQLTKRLTEKGYETGVTMTKKDKGEAITPITDEFTKEEGKSTPVPVSRIRFDVRA